jgi:predicted Zn-dependent protease
MPDIHPILAETLERCQGYYDLQMWEEAWEEIENLPDEVRVEPDAMAQRLNILMGMKEWNKAGYLGLGLSERFPDRMDFRMMTTQCLKNGGPPDDALEFIQSSPAAIWDHWAAWVLLAEIHLRRGCNEEAKKALKKCVELAPERRLEILDAMEFDGLW